MHRIKVTSIASVSDYLLAHDVCPVRYLEDLGLRPAALLANSLWLDRDIALRLAENLWRVTGDPLAGMHVAEQCDLRNYGLWWARIVASRTVGEALHAAAKRIDLIESGRMLELSMQGKNVSLETAFYGELAETPLHYMDASLVIFSRIIGIAADHIPLEVHLAREAPADTSEIERLLGPNLVFNADTTALVFDRDALAVPLDDAKTRLIQSPSTSSTSSHAVVTAKVAKAIQQAVRYGRPRAEDIARSLAMSVRTMQRHLAAWGITYEQLIDDLLLHYAMIELGDEGHSITKVAFDLGYSDSAHFTRAFKRWTGCTPRQFRYGESRSFRTVTALLTAATKS
jgi:AraC-like DNA-binding protein